MSHPATAIPHTTLFHIGLFFGRAFVVTGVVVGALADPGRLFSDSALFNATNLFTKLSCCAGVSFANHSLTASHFSSGI